jgi:hypothetical protein
MENVSTPLPSVSPPLPAPDLAQEIYRLAAQGCKIEIVPIAGDFGFVTAEVFVHFTAIDSHPFCELFFMGQLKDELAKFLRQVRREWLGDPRI